MPFTASKAGSLANIFVAAGIVGIIIGTILAPIVFMLIAMIVNVIAKWLGTTGNWRDFYKANASIGILQILASIPVLNWIVGLWNFILTFFLISKVYDFSVGKTIGCWVLTLLFVTIVFTILMLVLAPLFAVIGLGALAGASLF